MIIDQSNANLKGRVQRRENETAARLHSEKMNPRHANYDADYAADWRTKEAARKARNQQRRAAALAHARQYVQSIGIDRQFPQPVEPNDEGDDLYTETAPRRGTRKSKSKATATTDDQDDDAMDVDDNDNAPDDGWNEDDDVSYDAKEE